VYGKVSRQFAGLTADTYIMASNPMTYGSVGAGYRTADTYIMASNPMCPPLKQHPSAWQTVLRHSHSPLADHGLPSAMAFGWQIQRKSP